MGQGKSRERLPEPPPGRKWNAGRLHGPAPAPRRVRPAGKTPRDHRFELAADRLAEDWRRAISRNPDDERGTVDDGAEGKVAIGGLVDHVDGNASCARRGGEAPGVVVVVEAADGNGGSATEIFGLPQPMSQHDRAARTLRGHGAKLLAWTLGKDGDIGTRCR